jgi:hypothetical protein
MGLFKKKQASSVEVLKCPAEGCSFTTTEPTSLEKHVEWKHPELKQSVKKS